MTVALPIILAAGGTLVALWRSDFPALPTVVGTIAVATLVGALAARRAALLGWSVAGVALAIVLTEGSTHVLDARWPIYAALLLLLSELSFGALEAREAANEEVTVRRRRLVTTLALVATGAVVASAVLVLASVQIYASAFVLAAIATAAAIGYLRLVVVLVAEGTRVSANAGRG